MKADILGSILLVVLKPVFFLSRILQNLKYIVLTGTLDIAPNDKPQPFVIFFSNGSGTDTVETNS